MCLCVRVNMSQSVYVSVCPCEHVSVCVCVHISVCVCVNVSLCLCLGGSRSISDLADPMTAGTLLTAPTNIHVL